MLRCPCSFFTRPLSEITYITAKQAGVTIEAKEIKERRAIALARLFLLEQNSVMGARK